MVRHDGESFHHSLRRGAAAGFQERFRLFNDPALSTLPTVMSDSLALELTTQQRDLVLEGLRYIRSVRRLAFRDPMAPPDEKRDLELRQISDLMGQLDPATRVAVRSES